MKVPVPFVADHHLVEARTRTIIEVDRSISHLKLPSNFYNLPFKLLLFNCQQTNEISTQTPFSSATNPESKCHNSTSQDHKQFRPAINCKNDLMRCIIKSKVKRQVPSIKIFQAQVSERNTQVQDPAYAVPIARNRIKPVFCKMKCNGKIKIIKTQKTTNLK